MRVQAAVAPDVPGPPSSREADWVLPAASACQSKDLHTPRILLLMAYQSNDAACTMSESTPPWIDLCALRRQGLEVLYP